MLLHLQAISRHANKKNRERQVAQQKLRLHASWPLMLALSSLGGDGQAMARLHLRLQACCAKAVWRPMRPCTHTGTEQAQVKELDACQITTETITSWDALARLPYSIGTQLCNPEIIIGKSAHNADLRVLASHINAIP